MSEHDLGSYVEVGDRIQAFYEKYPDGSLQSDWELVDLGGPCIVVKAQAYRDANDPRPGVGLASEPLPGKTPFTRDSELMNAETSAWGRALAALGFKVKDGIASANEVRTRGAGAPVDDDNAEPGFASDKQRELLERLLKEDHGWNQSQVVAAVTFLNATLSGAKGGGISKTIDALMSKAGAEKNAEALDRLSRAAQKFAADQGPADVTTGPQEPDAEAHDESIRF